MIWRDFYIEMVDDRRLLREGLAAALNLQDESIAVVSDELEMPDAGQFKAVAVLRACVGDVRHMASLYLFEEAGKVDQIDDHAFAQTLADSLDRVVLLPDESSMDPFLFIQFHPHVLPVQVSIDPVRLDKDDSVWIEGGVSQSAIHGKVA